MKLLPPENVNHWCFETCRTPTSRAIFEGERVESIERHGKLPQVGLSGNRELIISPMLTGALMWCEPATQMMVSTVLVFEMKSGK
jgi:hypothetical protein